MELHEELGRRANEESRNRENSSRLAQSNARYLSVGQGSSEFSARVDFGVTFIEEPFMAYGAALDLDELAEMLGVDPGSDDVPMPLSSGYVTSWDQDERDFYIGAWVGARVYFPESEVILTSGSAVYVPADLAVRLTHSFTFSGIAMKTVPLEGAAD